MRRSCRALWETPVTRIDRPALLNVLVEVHHRRGPTLVPIVRAGMRAVFVEAEIAAYVTTNPAEGRALQEALRQRLPAHTTTHHAALDWTAAPALAAALRARHRPGGCGGAAAAHGGAPHRGVAGPLGRKSTTRRACGRYPPTA